MRKTAINPRINMDIIILPLLLKFLVKVKANLIHLNTTKFELRFVLTKFFLTLLLINISSVFDSFETLSTLHSHLIVLKLLLYDLIVHPFWQKDIFPYCE
jgi:hypothetical protein